MKQIRKMQSDFVANASHEMKTPLASIMGLVETIQTTAKNDPEAQADFLKIVGDQAFRMKTLIEDLLSLSKIEADTTAPETKVDIVKIVSDAKKHVEWAASQRNVNVKIDVRAETPLVLGDENQLSQVFINLISNAIKYGFPDSEVLVEVKISRKLPIEMNDRFDKAVEISVMDHSEGIPPEHLPRLTERFYRVDSGRSKKMGGTGLGLAIVKHIINRHNGALDIKSKVGIGSTFSVYLPIRAPSL
jgi:two-component system phosphate regulon sensor histidine kinase PhoR